MKQLILFLYFGCCTALSFGQNNGFTVTGNLPETFTGKVIMINGTDSFETVCNGTQFLLKGTVKQPKLFRLFFAGYKCKGIIHPAFYLENSAIQLTFKPGSNEYGCYALTQVTGSATQTQINDITKSIRALRNDTIAIKKEIDLFISSYPHNVYGPVLIKSFGRYFGKEWTVQNFEKLDTVLQHQYAETIDAVVRRTTILQPGQLMPDFEQTTFDGQLFRLSSLTGKTVLIDFWASWCGPCRREIPGLLKLYKKYRSKGFEIVSVSLDDEANKWKQAIMKERLTWVQISDLKGWKNELAQKYAINSIPFNILLNTKGEIIQTGVTINKLSLFLKKL